ncbi:MAG: hypothetical protein LBQ78_05180 [Tannerellaceae bacterium]|jgi:hypothetical protein|nr:hypothetical protein [Tannerellaceae bacterium]
MNRKITLIVTAFFYLSILNATVEVTTVWQISKAGNNLDEARDFSGVGDIGDNVNRGLAYGKFGNNEYVFILTGSGTDGNEINYYNANTGAWAGSLNTAPLNADPDFGAIHKITDIEIKEGKIYTVSLSVIGNNIVFCMWNGVDAVPIITKIPEATTIRVEKLSISGDISAGTGKIWIAGATEGLANPNPEKPVFIKNYALASDGTISTTATLFGKVPDNNNFYNCSVNPNGSVFVKGANKPLHLLAADGSYLGNTQAMTPELTLSQTVKYVGTNPHNGRYYFLLNSYSRTSSLPSGNGTVAKIYSMLPDNLNSINCVAQLPFLGDINSGNNIGDLDFKWIDKDLYVYSLSSNNGFGAFKITGLFDQPVNRSNDQFTLLWENSSAGNNLPGFYSANENDQDKTTGLAYGIVGGEKSVYVVKKIYFDPDMPNSSEDPWGPSGDSRKNIFIYDADNGAIKGELSIGGIWGKEIHDGTVTEDGVLLVSFVVNERETMNVFSFPNNQHEGSLSNVTFAYDSECPALLGGNISAIGSVAAGTAKLYATSQSSTSDNYVYTFGMRAPNIWEGFYAEEEFTIPSTGKGSVSVKADKTFYWNAQGEDGKFLYHNGTVISGMESTLNGSVIRYITNKNGLDYIAVLNENKVEVYTLTPGEPDTRTLWATSPILGTNPSTVGDIEVGFDSQAMPVLYVLSANNGFAAWKLNLDAPSGIGKNDTEKGISVFVDPISKTISFSEIVKKVDLFALDGRIIQSQSHTNTLKPEWTKGGIYVVRYTDLYGHSATKKIVIP